MPAPAPAPADVSGDAAGAATAGGALPEGGDNPAVAPPIVGGAGVETPENPPYGDNDIDVEQDGALQDDEDAANAGFTINKDDDDDGDDEDGGGGGGGVMGMAKSVFSIFSDDDDD